MLPAWLNRRHSHCTLGESKIRKTFLHPAGLIDHGSWCSSARFCPAQYVEESTLSKQNHANSLSVGMYIVARMLLGVGILFCIIAGSALIGELGYPKERPFLTSLFNASYFLGAIMAAAISIRTTNIVGNWSWRVPSLLQICPSLLQISTV